eukprot:9468734-Pyramimonas_sp.AAC.1
MATERAPPRVFTLWSYCACVLVTSLMQVFLAVNEKYPVELLSMRDVLVWWPVRCILQSGGRFPRRHPPRGSPSCAPWVHPA